MEEVEHQASIRQDALEIKITQLTQSLENITHSRDCLADKLAQQIRANEAYRKAMEEEVSFPCFLYDLFVRGSI